MKSYNDYHPSEGWVKFETLEPGTTFHDIIDGQSVEFIKIKDIDTYLIETRNATNLETGDLVLFDKNEFVYPINTGWLTELQCYGINIPDEIKAQGHKAIIRHIFQFCEGRRVDEEWRTEVTKYLPSLGMMSWSGPYRTVSWMVKQMLQATKEEKTEIQQRLEAEHQNEEKEIKKSHKEWEE
jgi:hypothetical protein